MSYRYAIGRRSIASVSHARDIANHIDWVPKDRWEFTAEDIINEINNQVGFMDNLHISFEGNRLVDVFTVLFEFLTSKPEYQVFISREEFVKYDWDINLLSGEVTFKERETPAYIHSTIFDEYSDYRDWVKLAKIFREDTQKVEVEYDGIKSIEDCYEWWDCTVWGGQIKIEKQYSKNSPSHFMRGWSIAPEYIKNKGNDIPVD